jgi:hypothetical protein
MLNRTYIQGMGTHFDKRIQERDLSLGAWILRRAGYEDADGKVHPIVKPLLHRRFCDRLDAFARGDKISQAEREDLTHCANAVAKDVLDNVLDTRHLYVGSSALLHSLPRCLPQ